ncbi:MAG: ferrous iron transport protein A [Limnochordales bacterium]|nr:ferrous iron transport protein A [Limnochordales bacterium]
MQAGRGGQPQAGYRQAMNPHCGSDRDPRLGRLAMRATAAYRRVEAAGPEWTGRLAPGASECRSLADLAAGEEACIIDLRCPEVLARRLADLGFIPGATVRVMRRFAGGRLMLVTLRGWRLALRQAEAKGVVVR